MVKANSTLEVRHASDRVDSVCYKGYSWGNRSLACFGPSIFRIAGPIYSGRDLNGSEGILRIISSADYDFWFSLSPL